MRGVGTGNWLGAGTRAGLRMGLLVLGTALALPLLALVVQAVHGNTDSHTQMASMWATTLPEQLLNSVLLCLGVAIGAGGLGVGSAMLVTLFDFHGRRSWQWALLLPMAMPAYVLAYAYADALQYSGPLQRALRVAFGWQGALWPDVRSTWGAAAMLSLALYPYVYLLVRTALLERAAHLLEAARLLGAGLKRRIWHVALPLARPALVAGLALALMETLADFGVVSYFAVPTLSTGIYKAWLVLDNGALAAQLSLLLLLAVALLLSIERKAQQRLRFSSAAHAKPQDARPLGLHGKRAALAWALCALPVVFGFVLPLAFLLWPLFAGAVDAQIPWGRFARWTLNSVGLALAASGLTLCLALGLSAMQRLKPMRLSNTLMRALGLGYAVPGTVLVVALLLPVSWLQARYPSWSPAAWVTTTVFGLLWAYTVRFSAVALHSIDAGYTRINRSLDESARLLGTGTWPIFLRVHWPQLKRPTAVAALLVFVDTMKELPATLVLRPFNADTLAVVAHQLAKDERLHEAALPSLAIVLAGLLPLYWLSRSLEPEAPAAANPAAGVAGPEGTAPRMR